MSHEVSACATTLCKELWCEGIVIMCKPIHPLQLHISLLGIVLLQADCCVL